MPQKIAMITVAAVVLAGGLFVGFSNDDGTPGETPATTELTIADSGGSIALSPGDAFRVTLVGNPTTGYAWEADDVDIAVLLMVGEPGYVPDSEQVIGSGGVYTFTFEATAVGETDLTLVYHRPWEDDVEPIETFTVHVTVS